MNDPRFEPENLNPVLSLEAREAICDLVLAWATYDSLIAQWIIVTFDLPLDCGAILIGNMDTRTKLDRLETLYQHFHLSGSGSVKLIRKEHLKQVAIRNSVCHAHCAGTFKSEPERLVFAPVKPQKGTPGNMSVEAIHLDQIRVATAFARKVSEDINSLVGAALARRR